MGSSVTINEVRFTGMHRLVFPSSGMNSAGVSLYTGFHRLTTWKLCFSCFSVLATA
ncbi:hypothetical protein T01_8530 [Trichinella spiralis]|uniref:Uncharacterized protein n=1 Tax=Trichinella spiralis TaxID=6334 RepID=A0A0V0ZHC8_TRISP|nr:hypothetical protein T01_8530 [Trichinella spiralis]